MTGRIEAGVVQGLHTIVAGWEETWSSAQDHAFPRCQRLPPDCFDPRRVLQAQVLRVAKAVASASSRPWIRETQWQKSAPWNTVQWHRRPSRSDSIS